MAITIGRWFTNTILLVSFLILAAMGSYQIWTGLARNQVVHEIKDLVVLTPKVKQGGALELELIASRYRDCRAIVHRFIFRRGSNISIWSDITAGGLTPIGVDIKTKFSVQLPMWLTPGLYTYSSVVYNDCGDSIIVVRPPHAVQFEVVAGG